MGLSSFCIKYRKKEKKALKPFLIYGSFGSVLFHLLVGLGIAVSWEQSPEIADKPIEVTFADAPKPVIKEPEVEKVKPPAPPKVQEPVHTPPEPEPKIPPASSPETVSPKPNLTPASPQPLVPSPTAAPQKLTVSRSSVAASQGNILTGTTGSNSVSGEASNSTSGTPGNIAANQVPSGPTQESSEGGELGCVSNCQPVYPSSLRKQGIEGVTVLRFTLGQNGEVASVYVAQSSGYPEFDRAALEAGRTMEFTGLENRQNFRYKINFTLAK
jgi:protein TonB